ncbi:hypothetical protein BDV06DRAFT_229586, partial [Aspergillus oleicola]
MYCDNVPVLPLPGRPPSTEDFLEAVKYGSFTWAFLLPYLFYTGSALPETAGRIVSSKITVYSQLGSSEAGGFPQLRFYNPSFSETTQYHYFNPIIQPQFRHHLDDLYELVILRSSEVPEVQPVFSMFPNLNEWETRDLFSPHPSIPNLWKHRGRRDDIIVFLNGEKTNPVTFEEHVSRHPAVRSALVAGNQRFEASLLLEPATVQDQSKAAQLELIETVWPAIEEANAQCPAHARVSKSKILVVDVAKPMLRAGKGTVQRAGTVQLYRDEIDALYEDNIQPIPDRLAVFLPSLQHAQAALRSLVTEVTSWAGFDDGADFFTLGMDSLQALRLSAVIRSTLG